MKILVTGATGLVGKKLGLKLVAEGHTLVVISRNAEKAQRELPFPCEIIEADLNRQTIAPEKLYGVNAVIHLAGETIDGRWTDQKKKAILESRQLSTENLVKSLVPEIKILISTSAQGYYGSTSDQTVNESSPKGSGFLADVCEKWEEPIHSLKSSDLRWSIIRVGVVLSRRGGALKKLIGLFQKNLGAVISSGQQWMSWISLDDLVEVYYQALLNESYQGVINAVNSQPVTNEELTNSLVKALDVFKAPPVPGIILKVALGEMSSLVLDSCKVEPKKLNEWGFKFKDGNMDQFLSKELIDYKEGHGLFEAEQYLPFEIEKVFKFFSEAQNLEKITPDILHFHIEKMSTPEIQKGTLIDYNLKIHGVPAKWRTLIDVWDPPFCFVDTQLKGPYSVWHHTHEFRTFAGGTLMTDKVRFKLPMGGLGRLVAGSFVESDVTKIFSYRREVIAQEKF